MANPKEKINKTRYNSKSKTNQNNKLKTTSNTKKGNNQQKRRKIIIIINTLTGPQKLIIIKIYIMANII